MLNVNSKFLPCSANVFTPGSSRNRRWPKDWQASGLIGRWLQEPPVGNWGCEAKKGEQPIRVQPWACYWHGWWAVSHWTTIGDCIVHTPQNYSTWRQRKLGYWPTSSHQSLIDGCWWWQSLGCSFNSQALPACCVAFGNFREGPGWGDADTGSWEYVPVVMTMHHLQQQFTTHMTFTGPQGSLSFSPFSKPASTASGQFCEPLILWSIKLIHFCCVQTKTLPSRI